MPKEIAVRLYQNAKYGTTYAKGQRHQALLIPQQISKTTIYGAYCLGYENKRAYRIYIRRACGFWLLKSYYATSGVVDNIMSACGMS